MKAISMSPRSGQCMASSNAVVFLHGHQLERNLARAVTAEAAGTFVLVLAITSAAVAAALSRPIAGARHGSLAVPVAGGLALAIAVASVGHISDAHLNPAVTLGLAASRRFPWACAPGYVLAQFAGATAAAAVTWGLYGDQARSIAALGAPAPGRRAGSLHVGQQVPGPGQQLAGDRDGGDLLPAMLGDAGVGSGELGGPLGGLRRLVEHPAQPGRALFGDVPVPDGPVRAADRGAGTDPAFGSNSSAVRPMSSRRRPAASEAQRPPRRPQRASAAMRLGPRLARPPGLSPTRWVSDDRHRPCRCPRPHPAGRRRPRTGRVWRVSGLGTAGWPAKRTRWTCASSPAGAVPALGPCPPRAGGWLPGVRTAARRTPGQFRPGRGRRPRIRSGRP